MFVSRGKRKISHVKDIKPKEEPVKESVFDKWCHMTSMHGILDWKTSKSLGMRLVWMLLLLISHCLMTYEIQMVVSEFIKQEKWTTKVYKERSEDITYPSMVICNYNRLSWRKTKEFNFTGHLLSYFLRLFPLNYNFIYNFSETEVMASFQKWSEDHNFHTWESIFERMGSASCDMLLWVSVGDHRATEEVCDLLENSQNNKLNFLGIKMVYTREFGQCIQLDFNQETVKPQALGTVSGISLILNANINDYLDSPWFNLLDEGFALKLLSSGGLHGGEWLSVGTGRHFIFSMTKQKTILTRTSSDLFVPPCVIKPKLKILADDDYTRGTCFLDCELQVVAEICGCVNLIQVEKYPTCNTIELVQCVAVFFDPMYYVQYYIIATNINILNTFCYITFSNRALQKIHECESKCSDPCEDEKIFISASSTRFPSRRLQEALKASLHAVGKDVPLEDIASGFVAVDFYYKSMDVEVVDRYERITIHQLISNLGGQLGLWVGISVLTIYQAIIYLCHGMYNVVGSRKKH